MTCTVCSTWHSRMLFLCSGVVFALAFAASQTQAQTLKQAVNTAMSAHSSIREAQSNRAATGFEYEQAKGLSLPTLDFDAGVGPGLDTSNSSTLDQWSLGRSVGLSLAWSVYDGGTSRAERARQASRADSASYRVLSRSEAVALNTIQAYLDVMRNRELVALERQALVEYQSFATRIDSRVTLGASGTADRDLISQRVSRSFVSLRQAEQKLADSVAVLSRYLGRPPGRLTRPRPPVALLPKTVEAVVERALAMHPDIAVAAADVDVAEAQRRAAEAKLYPKITLEGRVSAAQDMNGTPGSSTDASVMLRLRYNLFAGFIDTNSVKEQEARLAEAEHRTDTVREETILLARQAWIAWKGSEANVAALESESRATERVQLSYDGEFSAGKRGLLDLVNTQNELFTSRASAVTARYTRDFAVYRVLAAYGGLLAALAVEPAPEATATARRKEIETPKPAVTVVAKDKDGQTPRDTQPLLLRTSLAKL